MHCVYGPRRAVTAIVRGSSERRNRELRKRTLKEGNIKGGCLCLRTWETGANVPRPLLPFLWSSSAETRGQRAANAKVGCDEGGGRRETGEREVRTTHAERRRQSEAEWSKNIALKENPKSGTHETDRAMRIYICVTTAPPPGSVCRDSVYGACGDWRGTGDGGRLRVAVRRTQVRGGGLDWVGEKKLAFVQEMSKQDEHSNVTRKQ